jgi:RecB family exonuclease
VYVSCSDLGFSGPQLPPSEFLAAGGVIQYGKTAGEVPSGDRLAGSSLAGDPYEVEELYWAREKKQPEQLFPMQKEGFEAMRATGFAPKGIDYTRDLVGEPELARRMLNTARRKNAEEDGRVWLTPSSFDVYAMCPFAYLLQRGLKLNDEEYSRLVIEHRTMGTILHRILADLYTQVGKEDGCWKAEHTESYLQIADAACEREFGKRERRGEDFAPPAWYWFTRTAREQIRAFVREEGRQFDGFVLEGTELELAEAFPEGGAGMWGRIDRLTRKDDAAVLVDYKKGKVPATDDVYQEEGLPASSQLPFYAHVARHNGYRIAAASYYSLKDGRYTHLFVDPSGPVLLPARSKARLQPEQFFGQADRIAAAVEQITRRMRAGDFTIREDCPSCDFRTICRARYILKLPEEQHGA